uniref:PH domain-containing protein n=1 Tax=Erpetoichthys calabaricus TaxID=27687 RepID=A0A8C4SQM2_ERPCA
MGTPPGSPEETAWKKRYFILFCDSGTYHLNYYKNEHKTEQPKGKIDLSLITVLSQHPECHKKWSLLKNMFNCHLDFVLLIITKERDYFLIGESKYRNLLLANPSCYILVSKWVLIGKEGLLIARLHSVSLYPSVDSPFFSTQNSAQIFFYFPLHPPQKTTYTLGHLVTSSQILPSLQALLLSSLFSITQWRGAPHVRHLFCRGDRILAINDLRTETAKDVELYLNKVMKTQVRYCLPHQHHNPNINYSGSRML